MKGTQGSFYGNTQTTIFRTLVTSVTFTGSMTATNRDVKEKKVVVSEGRRIDPVNPVNPVIGPAAIGAAAIGAAVIGPDESRLGHPLVVQGL